MDKREALEIYLKAHDECSKRVECKHCVFYESVGEKMVCALCYTSSNSVAAVIRKKLEDMGEKQEAKHFDPSKNIFGVFASGPSTIKEPVPMPEDIGPIVVAKNDNVNHPKHYLKGGLECIQVIKAQLTPEQYEGYLYGNVIKYMWRWKEKNGLEDLRKAAHYLMWLQEEVKKNG